MDSLTVYTFIAFVGQIGTWEVVLIFAVLLVAFGPGRLPEIARSLGRAIDQMHRFSQEFRDQIMNADIEPPDGEKPPQESTVPQQENMKSCAEEEDADDGLAG